MVSLKNYDTVAKKIRCGCDHTKYDWNPLAELNQSIFNFSNGFVIFVIQVLQTGKCTNLAKYSRE